MKPPITLSLQSLLNNGDVSLVFFKVIYNGKIIINNEPLPSFITTFNSGPCTLTITLLKLNPIIFWAGGFNVKDGEKDFINYFFRDAVAIILHTHQNCIACFFVLTKTVGSYRDDPFSKDVISLYATTFCFC
jgi:hypothetical protein